MRSWYTGAVLVVALALCVSCFSPERRQSSADASAAKHRAEILKMYRDCLKRAERDPSVDCSQFERAVQQTGAAPATSP